jgi:hypothetical protein
MLGGTIMDERVQEWLNTLEDDDRLHHLGEFYTHLTKKAWRTPRGKKTKAFMVWYHREFPQLIDYPLVLPGFMIIQDWDSTDFIQRVKS